MKIIAYANGTRAVAPEIPAAEHKARVARVRSVACPACGQPAGKRCVLPDGGSSPHHQARWDAYYQQPGVS